MAAGDLRAGILDAGRRRKLLSHANPSIRQRAAKVLAVEGSPSRAALVDPYRQALELNGVADLSFLDNRNRQLCIEGLLRTEARSDALKQAMAKNKNLVQPDEIESLRQR
jgi:hypothetical protein